MTISAQQAAPASIPATGRVQLALNVSDLDASILFYSKLFGVRPAKVRPGYANFVVEAPPLKLVLLEGSDGRSAGVQGALNHLGVEVAESADVQAATRRLTGEGLDTLSQDATECCYAVQDKVWVHDPDGAPWEVYTVLADAPAGLPGPSGSGCATVDGACVPAGAEWSEHGVPLTPTGCC